MKIKNITHIFDRLGFGKYSARVYEAIRTHTPLSATEIITQAKIHRPAAYRAIAELLGANLISIKKIGRRNFYAAEDTERLLSLFMGNISQAKKIINKIERKKSRQQEPTLNSPIQLLKGPKGIRAAFDDVILHMRRGQTFFRYTSERDLESVNKYLSPGYRERRDKKHLERLVISNPLSGSQKRPRLERFIKFIPAETNHFDQNIIELIYGDRVSFIDLNTEEALIIENASLADFQKVIFKQLYKKL